MKEKPLVKQIEMNNIEARLIKSDCWDCTHLHIFIDGIRFDKWLTNKTGNNWIIGLIPSWLGWFLFPQEAERVWEKTKLCEKEITNLPVLICPDDLDLECDVIVCEVKYSDKSVHWLRIGKDASEYAPFCANVGKDVKWFQNVPELEFSRAQYETCIDTFKTNHIPYYSV